MRQVGIVGVGHTKFGKWEGTFLELITQAALQAMDDAGAKTGKDNVIDQVFVASMGAGMLNRISGSASALVDTLNIRPAMAECIENGPASGASAIKLGYMAIASGVCDCVLVVGGEQMRVIHPDGSFDFYNRIDDFSSFDIDLLNECSDYLTDNKGKEKTIVASSNKNICVITRTNRYPLPSKEIFKQEVLSRSKHASSLQNLRLRGDGLDSLGGAAHVVLAGDLAGADEARELTDHDVGVKLGDGLALLDRVGADDGQDADLVGTSDGSGKLVDGHGVLGVVEEGGLHACGGQGLRQNVAHTAARLQALHELRAGDKVRAVGDDLGKVNELSSEEAVKVVLLAELVRLLGELVDLLAIQIGLGVDDKEGLPELHLLHTRLLTVYWFMQVKRFTNHSDQLYFTRWTSTCIHERRRLLVINEMEFRKWHLLTCRR